MKNSIKFAIMTVIGLAAGSSALAQDNPGGPGGRGPRHGRGPEGAPKDAATMVEHLTKVFATVAPYDVNKDGKLDETELQALSQAIKDGTVQAPEHRTPRGDAVSAPPKGGNPRLAEMYSKVAPYDVDKDGVLSETEQAALKSDIESGKLTRPGGPRGHGGPRGERPPIDDSAANSSTLSTFC
jgi:hypothetical protein